MKMLRDGLRAIIHPSVVALNSEDTDEMLIASITEHIVDDKLAKICIVRDDLIVGHHSLTSIPAKKINTEISGIWLYIEGNTAEWELIKCQVIGEAIRLACEYIGDVIIIIDGIILQWDIFDCENAFYLEGDSIKLIRTVEVSTVEITL